MKKRLKIFLFVVCGIAVLFILDLACIFIIHRPILATREENGTKYRGLLYDTYVCKKGSVPQIKAKGIKFACSDSTSNDQETVNNKTFDFYISKKEGQTDIKYEDYLTFNDRKYYLANNIEEFYVVDGKAMSLRAFITNFDHSLSDHSLKKITDKFIIKEVLKDGGTTIYESKDKDLTIIECKTIAGNDDVYIGDRSIKYDFTVMCK